MLLRLIGEDIDFPLCDGVFTIGSDDDDHIYFESLGKKHLEFVYIDEKLFLQKAKGAVYLNGNPVKAYPCELSLGEVLSLSEEIHLFYGKEGEPDPAKPVIVLTTQEKRMALPWRKLGFIGIGLLGLMLMTFAMVSWMPRAEVVPEAPGRPPEREILASQAQEYFKQILGGHLLAIKENDQMIEIRVLESDARQMKRWQEDIELILPKVHKDVKVIKVNQQQLMQNVKQRLEGHRFWRLQVEGLKVTVSAACTPAQCRAWKEELKKLQVEDVQIVDNFYELKDANLKIISVTVSKYASLAKLEQNGSTMIVPEGGQIFNLGRLQLIRQNGIEVATPHGQVFIPWHKEQI
jgi:hypothetical protein